MRKQLAVYLTGGVRPDWTELAEAMAAAGADYLEIGLPFSDPMLDGYVIQEASHTALGAGATFTSVLRETAELKVDAKVQVMTYANHAFSRGLPEFCQQLVRANVSGVILPDLPLGEAGGYLEETERAGLDAVLMVTPATPPARVEQICRASRGYVYVQSVMATTGTKGLLGQSTWDTIARAKAVSPVPVLAGFGIDGPQAALQAAQHADGVAVGASIMRRVLDGASARELSAFVHQLREAIDQTG